MIRFNETEIRNSAKETLESLGHWSRRIINDKFIEKYGADYFDYKFESGEERHKGCRCSSMRMKKELNELPTLLAAADDLLHTAR